MTKRVFDILVATSGLIILSPIVLTLALIVRWRLGTPVIFAQTRPGLDGKPFTLYKFRTMTDARDKSGELLPDKQRFTPFGLWLRATSLDELPELWNVIKGEMSLVGPRPLLTQYLPLYSTEQAQRHDVRPGITGWAQINGRNTLMWDERFELDVWYVENHTLWLDLKILVKTIGKVIMRRDVSHSELEVTMAPFRGNEGDKN